jgi:hypothetical protein
MCRCLSKFRAVSWRLPSAAAPNIRDKVELKLSSETAAELVKRPVTYDAGFTLLPGTYTLKFLARMRRRGGSVPTCATLWFPISSVVLSSQTVDMRDALYNAKDKLHAQSLSPLIQNGRKMVPSVTHVFSWAKEMYAYVQAYQRQAAAAQPIVGFVAFFQGGVKVLEAQPVMITP